MYLRRENTNPLSVISSTLHISKDSKENIPLQHQKSGRKSSLGSRGGLAELPVNKLEYSSNTKGHSYRLPRQASIQLTKNQSKLQASNIGGSRWLDNDKEMMEFILNLKSKKSESKFSKGKKQTEPFQFQDRRDEQKDLLCNHMLLMKKIEKYEKQAISCFYEKDYNKCFGQLAKAQSLMKKQKIESPQHQLYINYLYAQFYFKLEKYQKWKYHLARAKSYAPRIDNAETGSMREYILNLKALEICLASHEELYGQALTLIEELRRQGNLSSKIRRRVSIIEISALRKLCRFKQALKAIEFQCEALQTDKNINEEKKDGQFVRLFEAKIEITAQCESTEAATRLIECLINFDEVSDGSRERFSYYSNKIYHLYAELLVKLETERIKLIFFYEKWIEVEESKKQKLKIQLQLFRMLYEMGIYERALQLFDSISSENVVYLGPEYLFMFASIKHFNGQEKQAISIMTKSIDICEDESSRALNMYRILEFDLEEKATQLRYQMEQELEMFLKKCDKVGVEHVFQLYIEYLKKRNQNQRANTFSNLFKKTAHFQSSALKHQHSNSNARKK